MGGRSVTLTIDIPESAIRGIIERQKKLSWVKSYKLVNMSAFLADDGEATIVTEEGDEIEMSLHDLLATLSDGLRPHTNELLQEAVTSVLWGDCNEEDADAILQWTLFGDITL